MYAYGILLEHFEGTKVEDNPVTMRRNFLVGSYTWKMEMVEVRYEWQGNRTDWERDRTGFTLSVQRGWQCQPSIIATITFRAAVAMRFTF